MGLDVTSDSEPETDFEPLEHSTSLNTSPDISIREPSPIAKSHPPVKEVSQPTKEKTQQISKQTNVNKYADQLTEMAEQQQKRLILNIGGRKFETSAVTMSKFKDSLLAEMVQKKSPLQPYSVKNIYTYFIDRNPTPFVFILEYLRNGDLALDALMPTETNFLRTLLLEARYYRLRALQEAVRTRLMRSILPTLEE